jgi:predicted RNase H-like nuclease (RuvC/YqgF family)
LQLAEFYKKGESALLIFQDSAPLEELDTRNRQFDEVARRNQALDAELQNLKAENESLQATIAKWDAYFTEKFGKPTAQTADEMAHNLLVEKLAQRTAEAQAEEDFAELLKVGATKSPEQRA